MHTRLTDFLAYRWRYILGYTLTVVVIGVMLAVAAFYVPHELRQAEIDSALTSATLGTSSMLPPAVVDLPYHLLQKIGFVLFGVSTFSIKLPSIILGALTVLGVFLLIRTWFRASVAILSTVLVTVTSQFLFLAQDGTPGIMFAFISIWLLFVATFVTRLKHFGLFWKVLTCIAMALSVYTPAGIYLVLVMLTTALFHPHIRFLIKRFNRLKISIALALGLATMVPLGYAVLIDHSIASTLLGVPTGAFDLKANFMQAVNDMFGFATVSSTYLIRPLYPIGIAILMLVGLYRILTHRYTARSYITISWGVVIILLIIISPSSVTNFFAVSAILVSYGIIEMIRSWYRIFPRNPYARIAGMIPLVVLVLAFVMSGITRYISTYRYDPQVMAYYSSDLRLLTDTLTSENAHNDTTQVVVSSSELPFYQLVAKYDKRFSVSTVANAKKVAIYSSAAKRPSSTPNNIVVNSRASDADRFYIYK
jgi:hypothetical protein